MFPKLAKKPSQTINDIEGVLLELTKYGEPRVSYMARHGFYARIEVFVTGKGTSFDVQSRYFKNPTDAVIECYERLKQSIDDIIKTQSHAIQQDG